MERASVTMQSDRSESVAESRSTDGADDTPRRTESPAPTDQAKKWDPQTAGTAWIEAQRERKRAGDRRAQQKLRDKRVSRVQSLENQVTTLSDELRELRHLCETLYQENQILHSQRDNIRQAVGFWDRSIIPVSGFRPAGQAHQPVVQSQDARLRPFPSSDMNPILDGSKTDSPLFLDNLHTGIAAAGTNCPLPSRSILNAEHYPGSSHGSLNLGQHHNTTFGLPHQQNTHDSATKESEAGPWSCPPIHDVNDTLGTEQIVRYLQYPELVIASSDVPEPLEIIYGSTTNFLANTIHQGLLRWPSGEPERLAMGMLHYQFIRWTSHPTKATFSRLCDFQKPVYEQLSQAHHFFIDFIMWPQLRSNLIKYKHLYNPLDAMSMLNCCQKMRWPWRKPFLKPGPGGVLTMCPEFYKTFTSLDGWGLTDEYIKYLSQYPELLEGIDVDAVRFHFA